MNKPYDTAVLIGRFQPVHNAHIELIRKAAEIAHQIIIIVGSANQPRTFKNPWTFGERTKMLYAAIHEKLDLEDLGVTRLQIEPNIDTIYNDQAWAIRVQETVARHTDKGEKIVIVGHDKDETSFYLKMFPQWGREEVGLIEPLHATGVRDLYFQENPNLNYLDGVVPESTKAFLFDFLSDPGFAQLVREREFIAKYKKQYASLAYAPTFVTTDAVVIQSGNVLMIKRRAEPGKGLWALPGGFLNAATDRSVQACMIRELREETGIKVPAPVLIGSIKETKVFDAIERSARGRTIDHAFKIVLPDGPLPKVKGLDDAEKAEWIPIGELDSSLCFEDHAEIISYFVGS